MSKKKQPDPDLITLVNQINPNWTHRVNLSEADARQLAEGVVPGWLQRCAEFWERDNPKPSDVPKLDPLEELKVVNG